ncbi:MAG: flagellar protein FlaG [Nitrosomonadales bacterium]|nr:flagellar protein FlaG [Nitrosomonadales bacterium]
MLTPNVSSTTQASPPARLASDGAPVVVVATHSNVEASPSAPAESAAKTAKADAQPSPAELKQAVDSLNRTLKQNNKNLEFSVDNDTKKVLVKLVDTETGDVIREFPSKEALAIARSIDQFQQGLLLKQQA